MIYEFKLKEWESYERKNIITTTHFIDLTKILDISYEYNNHEEIMRIVFQLFPTTIEYKSYTIVDYEKNAEGEKDWKKEIRVVEFGYLKTIFDDIVRIWKQL